MGNIILNSWEPKRPWQPSVNAIKQLKKKNDGGLNVAFTGR